MLLFQTDEPEGRNVDEEGGIKLDVSKLSKKEQAKLLAKEAPEFAGIVADFEERMKEFQEKLGPALEWIEQGLLPMGSATEFIRLKSQITMK